MLSNHLTLRHPLLLLPSIFPRMSYSQLAGLSLGKWKTTQVPVGACLEESTTPSTFQRSSSNSCLKASIKQGWLRVHQLLALIFWSCCPLSILLLSPASQWFVYTGFIHFITFHSTLQPTPIWLLSSWFTPSKHSRQSHLDILTVKCWCHGHLLSSDTIWPTPTLLLEQFLLLVLRHDAGCTGFPGWCW